MLNLHQQRKQNNTLKICLGSPTDNSVRHHERECLSQILVSANKVLLARTFTEVIDKVKRSWFDWLLHIFHLRQIKTAFVMNGNANAQFSLDIIDLWGTCDSDGTGNIEKILLQTITFLPADNQSSQMLTHRA